jgi:hypothetical protein
MRAGGRGMGMHGCWSLSRSRSSTGERCRPFFTPGSGQTTAFTAGAGSQHPSHRPPSLRWPPVRAGRHSPSPCALCRQGTSYPRPVGPARPSNHFAPRSRRGRPRALIRQTVPSHRRAGRHRSRLLRTGSPRPNRSIGGHADRLLRRARSQRHRCRLLGSGGVQVPDGDLVAGVMGV